jgi:hypothetical protein
VDILRDVLKRRRRSFGPAFERVCVLYFVEHAVIPGVQVETFDLDIVEANHATISSAADILERTEQALRETSL